jgi:hypothetical protein
VFVVLLIFLPNSVWATQPKLASAADYHRYIDAFLDVKDFGTYYFEDGAADATVLFHEGTHAPYGQLPPAEPIIALLRLRERAFPILIDCLDDTRITSIHFDGNNMVHPVSVPLGYVCLDVLMNFAAGKPVSDPDCSDDGLGACMNNGFYFRPDDYYGCSERECMLRPWVIVVQRNWKNQFLARRLKFHNPYDKFPVEEYKELRSLTK